MDKIDKERLRINHSLLLDDMDASDLVDDLLSGGVINSDEMDVILQTEPKTRRTRNRELLSLLPRKGATAYQIFCDSLESKGYEHLRGALNSTEIKLDIADWFSDLPDEVKTAKPTDKQLMAIAKDIGIGWEVIGLSLGLSSPDVDDCKMRYPQVPRMQIVTMFTKWRSKRGSKATMSELAEALRDNTVYDNAFKIVLLSIES